MGWSWLGRANRRGECSGRHARHGCSSRKPTAGHASATAPCLRRGRTDGADAATTASAALGRDARVCQHKAVAAVGERMGRQVC